MSKLGMVRVVRVREVMTEAVVFLKGSMAVDEAAHILVRHRIHGAPVLGDRQQWAVLLQKNFDVLLHNTLEGINGMPAKGGCTSCTGEEVIAAVKYMAEQAQPDKDYSLW